ncbi:MAG: pseudouridine-5'-phosphate glycosidase [Gammaproteobacteria bacterium]|nr:pseudouridine-5'-phosphate glycosidase [Gammaproteobacteria bacterium]
MTLEVHPEVAKAVAGRRGVVALESTIITHGMPYPQNLETARQVETDVRATGAVPATIAALDGKLRIGLSDDELQQLARARDQGQMIMKLSRADLAMAISTGATGSTTVAATMIAAQLAGIEFFATGGIGGVHRDGQNSLDVSADLNELARTPVTVICAGAKAILDIPRTLEYLETLGVPVVAYRSDSMPAFWSSSSPFAAPLRCDTVESILDFMETRRSLGLGGGILLANPVPVEHEIDNDSISVWISQALADARDANVTGKAITPYLLERINILSKGRSLTTNIALIRNNATLAGQLAVAGATRHAD